MGQQTLLEIMSVRWIWGNNILNRTEGLYLSGYVTYLGDLPLVAVVGVLGVVFQGFWACELVVAGRGGADVALACDLSGKACDGARYWGGEGVRTSLVSYDIRVPVPELPPW
jgi:hypothetical protein